MAQYVYIQNYNKLGTMGINEHVFEQIVEIATNQVVGATVSKKRYSLFRPVNCQIRNGIVSAKLSIKVDPGVNASEVAREVQTNVASALSMMTELIPFNINVEIIDLATKS